jgi:hypothetical protein
MTAETGGLWVVFAAHFAFTRAKSTVAEAVLRTQDAGSAGSGHERSGQRNRGLRCEPMLYRPYRLVTVSVGGLRRS